MFLVGLFVHPLGCVSTLRTINTKGISKEIVNIDDGTSMEMPLGLVAAAAATTTIVVLVHIFIYLCIGIKP